MTTAPEDFDWVTARSQCSVGEVFERLRQQVKQDVEKIEELRKQIRGVQSYFGFKFIESPSDFAAVVEGNRIYKQVNFQRDADTITAKGQGGEPPNLTARLTLSSDRQCRMLINEQEYELWQFRKMALESFFFEVPRFSTNT